MINALQFSENGLLSVSFPSSVLRQHDMINNFFVLYKSIENMLQILAGLSYLFI